MEENKCPRCGNVHNDLPTSYSADAPSFYEDYMSILPLLPPEYRARTFLSSDLCVVGNWFFIKGCIEIPVIDNGEKYIWDVWVLISSEDYDRSLMLWENPEREYERPYAGVLATRLPGYKETVNLKARVYTRAVGERPLIELAPSKHKLAREQQQGITLARVRELDSQAQSGCCQYSSG